jgi:glycosyltransferase involved in cell wall biosynthesis
LNHHPLLDELIVVNDGSKDNTLKVIKKFSGAKIITYKKNAGKSHAIMLGLKAARNKTVMLIDSDLVGLTRNNIDKLIEPVITGKADISMTLRKNSGVYRLFGLDFISGERVFEKSLIGDLNQLDKIFGYGLESFMNKKIIEQKKRIAVVRWENVEITKKSSKVGFFRGVIGELKMTAQIIKLTGWIGIVRIFVGMKRLVVK